MISLTELKIANFYLEFSIFQSKKRLGMAGGYAEISIYSNTTADTNPDDLQKSGNVESNPGPTPINNKDSKKGRPKKKGFCVKTENTITQSYANIVKGSNTDAFSSNNTLARIQLQPPLGLLNLSENVCFLNSIIQLLYHIPELRIFVQNMLSPTSPLLAVQNLFNEIYNSSVPVRSFAYIPELQIPHYIFKQQYDSHEFLTYLLDKIYPSPIPATINNNCVFKVQTHTSVICENCNHSADRTTESNHITLNVNDTRKLQTINGLLAKYMDRGHAPDYTCDNCNVCDNCFNETTITDFKDMIILQLSLFKYIPSLNITQKIRPTIKVDQNISLYGISLKLHGIIYHDGLQPNSGHYTAAVDVNDNWFTISDSNVVNRVTLSCTYRDSTIPYILMYKRSNATNNNINNPVSIPVGNSCSSNINTNPLNTNAHCSTVIPKKIDSSLETKCKPSHSSIDQSFDNLCKVVENCHTNVSSDSLKMAKKSVVKELFNQTEKIVAAKIKRADLDSKTSKAGVKRKSKFTLLSKETKRKQNMPEEVKESNLNNLKNKRKSSMKTSIERIKKFRAQQTPEKNLQETESAKQRMDSLHAQQTPDKKSKAKSCRCRPKI